MARFKFKGKKFIVSFLGEHQGKETVFFVMRKGRSGIRWSTPQKEYAGRFSYEMAQKLSNEYCSKSKDKTAHLKSEEI